MIDDMKIEIATGDYIKDKDKAVKVIGYSVEDVNGNQSTLEYIVPNIIINDEVLECCGFVKNGEKYQINYSDSNLSYIILVSKSQQSYRCDIYNNKSHKQINTKNDIMVLSILQDFIRQNTQGGELDIDFPRLTKEVAKIKPKIE